MALLLLAEDKTAGDAIFCADLDNLVQEEWLNSDIKEDVLLQKFVPSWPFYQRDLFLY